MMSKEFAPFVTAIAAEEARIAKRDAQLLSTELDWMATQPGLERLCFRTLDEYCGWLWPENPKAAKWDLLRHRVSQDTPYYPVYQKYKGPVVKPHHQDYGHRLVTHSLRTAYWQQDQTTGYLIGHPGVSFSSGQVVFRGSAMRATDSMTVIFDRQVLEKVYTLFPYADEGVEWEREIRTYEPINLGLSLGSIPTESFLSELNHWGQSTCVSGQRLMAEMEKNYLNTGKFSGGIY